MAILGKDKYEIEDNIILCDLGLESLMLLYQPLVGASAISLYLTLNKLDNHSNYSYLCLFMGLDIEVVEHSIIMLERYRLIKTYKDNSEDSYIHVLLEPILPSEFLSHYVYGLELRKHIGNHNFNLINAKYQRTYIRKTDFEEITEKKIFNIKQFNEKDLEEVLKHNEEDIVLPTQFNFDLFLRNTTNLQFPHVLRTKENLNIIAELALLYGISEERMQTLVYRSIDFKQQKFEREKLINRVRREQVEIDETANKYELPPAAFLQLQQNGASVSTYNKKLLEQLVNDMLLSAPVVNRLIEYIMETQNNRLVKNYVLQVAGTWKSYDIRTVEQANELIKKTSGKRVNKKQPKIVKRENNIEDKDEEYTKEQEQAIQERLKRFGEKYGTHEH